MHFRRHFLFTGCCSSSCVRKHDPRAFGSNYPLKLLGAKLGDYSHPGQTRSPGPDPGGSGSRLLQSCGPVVTTRWGRVDEGLGSPWSSWNVSFYWKGGKEWFSQHNWQRFLYFLVTEPRLQGTDHRWPSKLSLSPPPTTTPANVWKRAKRQFLSLAWIYMPNYSLGPRVPSCWWQVNYMLT